MISPVFLHRRSATQEHVEGVNMAWELEGQTTHRGCGADESKSGGQSCVGLGDSSVYRACRGKKGV